MVLNGETEIFSKIWGGFETQNIIEGLPRINIHIWRKVNLRLVLTNGLTKPSTKSIKYIPCCHAIYVICFCKKNQIIREKQMRESNPALRTFHRIPTTIITFLFDEMPKDFHAKNEELKRKRVTLSYSPRRNNGVNIPSIKENRGRHG